MDPLADARESPEHPPEGDHSAAALAPGRIRSRPLLAWIAILIVIALAIVSQLGAPEPSPTDDVPTMNAMMREQVQSLIGLEALQQWAGAGAGGTVVAVEEMDRGGVPQRLRTVVAVGEFLGITEALTRLAELRSRLTRHGVEATPEQQRTMDILERLYTGLTAGEGIDAHVTAEEQEHLRAELDWFGELALAPDAALWEGPEAAAVEERREVLMGDGSTTLIRNLVVNGLGLAYAAAGLLALVVAAVVLFAAGGRPRQWRSGHGGVYAETFALWLVMVTVFGLAGGAFAGTTERLLVNLAASALSMCALAWPVYRGLAWSEVRADIGWIRTGGVPGDFLRGVLCHLFIAPFLAVSMVFVMIAMRGRMGDPDSLAGPDLPSHPAADVLHTEGGFTMFVVFVLAVVFAPIVEETMFRGVLYRHLRESITGNVWVRAGLSMLLCAFVFAAIHPQGLLGMPTLMIIAVGFAIAREWRDSIYPAVWAHALNNGVVLGLSTLAA